MSSWTSSSWLATANLFGMLNWFYQWYDAERSRVSLDDLAARDEVGSTSRHPRWAFAWKFPPRAEVTRILSIIASVGRTGVVTPVAIMRPVEIGGVTVSRATLQ